MDTSIKKIVSYFLMILVLVFTVIAILGIWDLIDLEDIFRKIFFTLMVIFASTALVLFIFTVLIRGDEQKPIDKQ
jgi:hypothetical protein